MNKHWLVRPGTIRLVWAAFAVVLAGTVVAGHFVHGHVYFGLDGAFAFNAWFGLITCVALIVVAKGIGFLLKRRDTYYDRD